MELNSQINTFSKGMNADIDITMLPEGQYRYAENIRLLTDADGTTGLLQNIEYIRKYTGGIPSNETILGTATTRLYDTDTKGTVECGIVFTKKMVDNKVYNTLYKVTGFKSTVVKSEVITEGYLDIQENVSIVTNYESDYVSNVYVCDGHTPIKVINICDKNLRDENDNVVIVYDKTRFDITPGCVLIPFTFVNTINGALPAGAVQYCYQLFNQNGPETTTAALSEVIPITKYDHAGESRKVKGQMRGELSDRGCKIHASFKNDGRFDRARIFSIIYLDNISVPDIYIINEIEIPQSTTSEFTEFDYEDTGASFLSKITIDEFNAMVPFEFNAKSIEKMGNRLFASNTQELTWDVDYDARAYRCNSSGTVVLQHSDSSQTISGTLNSDGTIVSAGSTVVIPKEHDCINPSNVDVLNNAVYSYQSGGVVRGGTGPNVSYRFVYTEIVPSGETVSSAATANNLSLNATADGSITSLTTFDESKNTVVVHTLPTDSNTRSFIPNYADPYMCANFLGYQRDEIYRFGIIFYNNKNIPSPVHWIGDIRMPSIKDAATLTSVIYPFHKGEYSQSYRTYKEMVAYALGVEFTVKNVPSEAISYEIVRCDRNKKDRTVVTQGAMGALFKFTDWNESIYNVADNDVRPAPMLNLADNFKTYIEHGTNPDWNYLHTAVQGYFEFVSPEICISREAILQNIQGNSIVPLYKVNSAYGDRATIAQQFVYTVSSTNRENNDPDFGKIVTATTTVGANNAPAGTYFHAGHGTGKSNFGFAGVFKYYNTEYDSTIHTNVQIEDGIISQILPYFITLEDAKGYVQFVGNKSYINLSVGGYRQFSLHGVSAVLQVDESFKPHKTPTTVKDYCTAIIANIKQNTIPYGGNTYISRQNSIYVSCGCFNKVSNSKTFCYGGDTYLGILDYLNTSTIQTTNEVDDDKQIRLCCVSYIPLESQVNLNLRSDESYSREATGLMGPNLVQNEPTQLPNGYTQKKPYYEYNPVYSSTSGSKQYVPKSIYAVDKQINQTRIVASELKTNNEMTDSWTKFKFANYIDVDTQYGQITNLKSFNNRLYYWQDNAVGIAAVNERSLITDDNMAQLTLGTGGILARFDYVVTLNGSSIVNDKSITNSATTLYWYDFDKNEICALNNNGSISLAKQKGVQSYLNTLPRAAKSNVVSFYDKKYNEVWFRVYDKTLIYNEQLQVFTSFYTHNPNWFFPFSDKLVTIKNNNMYYLHNIYEVDDSEQPREERISKVEFVVNKDISNTKVFDNVVFSADLLDNNNTNPNIVKDVVFKTKTQETNPIDFNSIELREDNYRFPISREKTSNSSLDTLTSQSYLGRMRGKYLICDYTFDCNNNREFKLPYIKTTYRYSML